MDPNVRLNINVLVTLVCWGVWGIFDKKALEHSTHIAVLFRLYAMVFWELPLIVLYMNMTEPHWHIIPVVWFWTFWAALFAIASLASYLVAMSFSEASLVLSVTAAYPVITQWLAVAFLGEALIPARLIGAAGIALGVAAIGFSKPTTASHQVSRRDSVLMWVAVVVATFGWGIWGILEKKALMYASPIEGWFAEVIWDFVLMVGISAVAYASGKRIELSNKQSWLFSFLSAVCLAIGRIVFMTALKYSSASYVIAITGCYPLLMYFLALLFLKEKFNKVRLAGIILIVVGGLAVQFTQSG